jgi:hypothetical protein
LRRRLEPAAANIFLSRPPFAFVNGARGNRLKHGNKSFGHGCPLTAAAAKALAVESVALPVRNEAEIDAAIAGLGREQAALAAMDDSFMAARQAMLFPRRFATTCPRSSPGADLLRTAD